VKVSLNSRNINVMIEKSLDIATYIEYTFYVNKHLRKCYSTASFHLDSVPWVGISLSNILLV